jgi:hypothetical protein
MTRRLESSRLKWCSTRRCCRVLLFLFEAQGVWVFGSFCARPRASRLRRRRAPLAAPRRRHRGRRGRARATLREVGQRTSHSSFARSAARQRSRIALASLGKIPTTSARRPISWFTRSNGLVSAAWTNAPARSGRTPAGPLGGLEQLGDLRRRGSEALDPLAAALGRTLVAVGVEDLPERGGHHPVLRGTAVAQHVSYEMGRAARPRARQHPRDHVLQAEVLVRHTEAHPSEAAHGLIVAPAN